MSPMSFDGFNPGRNSTLEAHEVASNARIGLRSCENSEMLTDIPLSEAKRFWAISRWLVVKAMAGRKRDRTPNVQPADLKRQNGCLPSQEKLRYCRCPFNVVSQRQCAEVQVVLCCTKHHGAGRGPNLQPTFFVELFEVETS